MPHSARISPRQFAAIFGGFLIGTSTLVIPTRPAERDAWLSVLVAGILGLAEIWLVLALSARFPGKLPAEYFPEASGKAFGAALTLLYIWFCLHLGSFGMRIVMEALLTTMFALTPGTILSACMGFLGVTAVYAGIEALGRTCELLTPLLILGILGMTVLTTLTKDLFRVANLLPILERGPGPMLRAAFGNFTLPFGEAVVILSVLPYVNERKNLPRFALGPIATVAAILTLVQLRNTAALGPRAGTVLFPSLLVVRLINVGRFIQRLDSVLLFIWIFGTFMRIATCLFAVTVNTAVLTGVKDPRILAFPMAAIMAALSNLTTRSAVDLLDFADYSWPMYSFPFEVVLPLTVLIIAIVRKRGKTGKSS